MKQKLLDIRAEKERSRKDNARGWLERIGILAPKKSKKTINRKRDEPVTREENFDALPNENFGAKETELVPVEQH
ncbi:hypothetical protein TNCV_323981 [Trichonephila clavipes]|nr:hypothetical protein TNCV_323981 [Trichonephila clavipes]